MDLKLVHEVLLKKAKESNYTNLEIEEINHNYENLIIDFFLRRETLAELSKITVKDDELREIYELNKENFLMDTQVKIDTIFLLDEKKAEKILKEVNIKNFEEYKEKYDEKSKMEIGALDEKIPISNIHPSIVEAIENIPKKGISKKIVKTDDGYHIVYLKSREEARLATYEESRDLVIAEMNKKLYSEIYNKLIQKFVEEAGEIDLEASKTFLKNNEVSEEEK